jgi:hypothetical protein
MTDNVNLRNLIREKIYQNKGLITVDKLYRDLSNEELNRVGYSSKPKSIKYDIEKILNEYNVGIDKLILHVKEYLISAGGKFGGKIEDEIAREKIYNTFINQCDDFHLSETDFYKIGMY